MKYGELSADKTDALIDKIGGVDGLDKILSGEWTVGASKGSGEVVAGLLEIVGQAVDVAAFERFVARDTFVVGPDGALPLSYVGEDFTQHFLDLVETDVKAARLNQYDLLSATIDGPIFAALGGERRATIALAHLFAFLTGADRGKWFFFYVADVNGRLWAVDTYWRDGGWDMEAYSVTYPRGWRGGGCVVSA